MGEGASKTVSGPLTVRVTWGSHVGSLRDP